MKSRITALVARARGMDPFHADIALTAAFIVAAVLESALVSTDGGSRTVTAIVSVVALAPLAWMRRRPLVAVAGFVGVCIAQSPLDSFFFQDLTTPFVAILYLLYLTGRYAPQGRPFWVQTALIYGGVWAAIVLEPSQADLPADFIWTSLVFSPPLLAGRGIRSRVLLQRELRERAERADAEREIRAQRAVEDERTRIATELQAVVANGVSAMVVQADTVPRVLANGDTAGAAQALAVVEETGRDALAEMRRLLGVLRRDGEGPALAPQPSLQRADALVERSAGNGLAVQLRVEGDPVPLSSGVDLAAYRVLQQSLEWVREAGGASSAIVTISYDDRDVRLTVRDDRPRGVPDQLSLGATRDRLALYGGAIRTSPGRTGHGFKVEVRLPHGRRA